MPNVQQYALEKDGPKRIEVSWKGMWKELTVRFDGRKVGTVADRKELKAGRVFLLPDGSGLKVQLVQRVLQPELRLLRNGRPLPGSASDPAARLKLAYGMVLFVGGLNVVLGLAAELGEVGFLQRIGLGIVSIFFGLVFIGLGLLAKRGSAVALGFAVGLFAVDGIVAVIVAAAQASGAFVGGLIARVFFLIPMVGGFGAIRALKQQDRAASAAPGGAGRPTDK